MEDMVLNNVEIPVENQDIDFFWDLEVQHYTKYIAKPLVQENNYIDEYIKYTFKYFINNC